MKDVDPFDLPDWLGTAEVVWTTPQGVRHGHHVRGALTGDGQDDVPCDLLAVDDAYPQPVAGDDVRTRAHLAWRHGQILLLTCEDRLTLAVPGTSFTAEMCLDAIGRLAKAVGASGDRYAVQLRIGADRPRWEGSEF